MERGTRKAPAWARRAAALALAAGFAAPAAGQGGAPDNREALEGVTEMRIAFDITEGNPKALLARLNIIDTTRRQLIAEGVAPHFVLAFRGDASYFTQSDLSAVRPEDRADGQKVGSKLKELRSAAGVESIVQCALPLPSRKLAHQGVIPEVKVVGNGWITLVAYQRKGYAYIAP